ncbi:SRPBCC domain-containing protein [Dyadobacter sp. CY345]|uniref:SRPBCC family protein n=1 Tax=Dyadobacter sp. CY345 TaxID=2909335 RepID=UPI001F1EDF89|nr:SRPBCC family protein [Dyadobacter sp. CY345]MCF2443960.1 SRPBCC domain-containing protein [Dyadobacter sp. CY345]
MASNISAVSINAPIAKVWQALTQPELVKKWQFGSDLITDWTVGGEIRFRNNWEGQVFEQWGNILEFSPYEIIRYTLFFPRPDLEDRPENYFIMSYLLSEDEGVVTLVVNQEDNRPGSVQDTPNGEENQVLNGLKAFLEAE